MDRLIVAGIGTDVGKTVVAGILAKATGAAYWKPIQTGPNHEADRHALEAMVPGITLHPERHHYPLPMSPHAAAEAEDALISLDDFEAPNGPLITELAGGLLVPINDHQTNMDLILKMGMPVVLVSRYYLGSINHTLLSIALLRQAGVPLKGLVLNGPPVPSTREAMQAHGKAPLLLELPELSDLSPTTIAHWAQQLAL